MNSISVLYENGPTNATGQRPRWNFESGKFCVPHMFCPADPGRMEKAIGRLRSDFLPEDLGHALKSKLKLLCWEPTLLYKLRIFYINHADRSDVSSDVTSIATRTIVTYTILLMGA